MRRLLAIAVSAAILGVIYWRIDLAGLGRSLADAHYGWVIIAVLALIPALALTAWRLSLIAGLLAPLSVAEAGRLVLLAHSLNMILPSRLGDFIKAHAMAVPGTVPGREALSIVVIEKTWDALAVMAWCAVGLLIVERAALDVRWAAFMIVAVTAFGLLIVASRRFAVVVFTILRTAAPHRWRDAVADMAHVWFRAVDAFWRDRPRAALVIGITVLTWFLHLVEIWLFVVAIGVHVPFAAHLGLAPLVMAASLVPLTLSGIGTRDAAIIVLYSPFMDAPTGAALGLLVILRYLVPALVGIPFTARYLEQIRLAGKRD
jgi:hypothetical protein